MMEMTLIYTMGGAVESSYGADNVPVAETPLYGVSGFTPLNADYYWVASMALRTMQRSAPLPASRKMPAVGQTFVWSRAESDFSSGSV